MYTTRNFKTKKELKDAVAIYHEKAKLSPDLEKASRVTYFQPNDMGFAPLPQNGTIYVEGPHYPQPHKWYAQCEVVNGAIVKVR